MADNKRDFAQLARILLFAELQGMDTPTLARRSGLDVDALELMASGSLAPTGAQFRRLKAALASTGVAVFPMT